LWLIKRLAWDVVAEVSDDAADPPAEASGDGEGRSSSLRAGFDDEFHDASRDPVARETGSDREFDELPSVDIGVCAGSHSGAAASDVVRLAGVAVRRVGELDGVVTSGGVDRDRGTEADGDLVVLALV
jgi:hypothetical protein